MVEQMLGVVIVGCGNISGPYGETLEGVERIRLLGAMDLLPERAEAFVDQYGGRVYPALDDVLQDPEVDLVVNLTIHHAHPAVIEACLDAGKHVYSEKPLALTYGEAQALVARAEARKRRLACAPITFMGEAQQTAWKLLREGRIGTVRAVYAEMNHGRIETWHPNPEPFYDVGPLFDVAVYPLTILTTMFGPARDVLAYGCVLYPDRTTAEGRPFRVSTPEFSVALIEFADGPIARLTTNFYVGYHGKQQGIEFHGDLGSVYLGSWGNFAAAVEHSEYSETYAPVPLVREPYEGIEWSRAVADMADAIAAGRPQRATGAQAAHVVEIVTAIQTSSQEQGPVRVESTFDPPAPMDWAL